jgi:hypothetical protein
MTEETAKALADAMNRLAAAIESLKGGSFGGIQVYHHGFPQAQSHNVPFQPATTWGNNGLIG